MAPYAIILARKLLWTVYGNAESDMTEQLSTRGKGQTEFAS